jgi:hypothetical protein
MFIVYVDTGKNSYEFHTEPKFKSLCIKLL